MLKQRRGFALLLGLALVVVMSLAACGGDDDNGDDVDNGGTSPTTAPTLLPTLEATEEMMSTEEAGAGTTLDGATLVSERCTVCHTRERIDNADKDEAGWTATVDRMISNGAELNEEEREAVIAYLVETH